MDKFYKKYRIAGNWFNIGLLLSVIVPLLILSYYNHPSPADDYCYIDTVFKYGWVGAMNAYYTGWTGRYFGIFLNHSNPLLWHSVTGFKILPVVLLSALIFSLYNLFRHLTPTLSRLAHLGFAGVIFFLYVLKMSAISEAFYWMAAFVTYTVPNILTLLWIVVVLRWYRQDTQSSKIFIGVLSAFLVFAIIGCSETNLLILIILLGAWWVYQLLFRRTVDVFMIAMLVVAIGSAYFFFSSAGNQARIGGNPLSGNVVFSLVSSFRKLAQLTLEWVFSTPLLFFTPVWFVVLARLSPGARNYFSIPVWYAVLLMIGVLAAQLFPSYYGVGIEPTPRVINCVYLFFLIGWFYVSGVVYHHYHRLYAPGFNVTKLMYVLMYLLIILSSGFSFVKSANTKMIYGDLIRGTAAAYDKEVDHRYALIQNSKDPIVYLPPLKNLPQSIFVLNEDIKTDPKHWWNKCMAGYFGKQAIYMKNDEGGQK
jgi:hypothetical protein